MSITLNKDGTPRKIGSGKTKGAGCFSPTTLSVLKNYVSDDVEFPVSRVWLREVGVLEEDLGTKKKKAQLVAPSSSPPQNLQLELEAEDSPQRVEKEKAQETLPPESHEDVIETSEDEYEPPPLFAATSNRPLQY
ncbi:MAG: hypothetical protein CMI29_04215 [Opitutae bacterium]|nr:hypothetical protein [Opitutae bacterium]|tara:strand:+ start:3479 stop:3883 length:405 start_codon:yes stop_codon:yes gene_type:complete